MEMSKLMKFFEEQKGAYYNKMLNTEEFDRHFKQVNASWSFEGSELDEAGKRLIFQRLNGEITEEEFAKSVYELTSP